VTPQSRQGSKNFSEVGILAVSGEGDYYRAVQFRAVEAKAQRSGQFFLEESHSHLAENIRGLVAIDYQRSPGMDLDALAFEFVSLPPLYQDGQIQGNSAQRMIDDLIRLPRFHPNQITSSYVALHIRMEVASGYSPVGGERQG